MLDRGRGLPVDHRQRLGHRLHLLDGIRIRVPIIFDSCTEKLDRFT